MKVRTAIAVPLWMVAALFIHAVFAQESASPADMVVLHGKIYTVNAKQLWAQALAIRDGKIISVGSEKEIEKFRGASTCVIDAKYHLVLPGFVDTHVHFTDGAFSLQQVKLDDASSIAEIQKRVKEYAAAHPGNSFIEGFGWMYPVFGKEALPDKKYLDEVLPDRPALLSAYDGHTFWANSKALQMAGITRDTPDPRNGIIVHDPKTGEPTGALKESRRRAGIKIDPEPTRGRNPDGVAAGNPLRRPIRMTRVHSAGNDDVNLGLLDELRHQGQLTLRFYVAPYLEPPPPWRDTGRHHGVDLIEAYRETGERPRNRPGTLTSPIFTVTAFWVRTSRVSGAAPPSSTAESSRPGRMRKAPRCPPPLRARRDRPALECRRACHKHHLPLPVTRQSEYAGCYGRDHDFHGQGILAASV